MRAVLQFVCHTGRAGLLALGLMAAGAGYATPSVAPADSVGLGQSPSESSVAVKLEAEVLEWVSRQAGVPLQRVQMVPLDPRLQLKACGTPLKMDAPFNNFETVRVRCEQPNWQLYVRLDLKDKAKTGTVLSEAPKVLAPKRTVLVATSTLPRGTLLSAEVIEVKEIDAALAGPQALERMVDIENMELARGLAAGAPIRSFDLRPVLLVKKGQNVKMQLGQGRGFNITARLEALQDGRMGEQIRLKNPESGRMVSGVVVGESAVRGL